MKKNKLIGSLVLATCLVGATAAQASLETFDWVQSSTLVPGFTSTGTLIYNTTSGTVVSASFSFAEKNGPTYSASVANFTGTSILLSGGDLQLNGSSTGTQTFTVLTGPISLTWTPNGGTSSPTEQMVYDNTVLTGAWVPVPEPTTVLAGALMLLPLGIGAFRAVRKDRVA